MIAVYTERDEPPDGAARKIWKLVLWRVAQFRMCFSGGEVVIDADGREHRIAASIEAVREYVRRTWNREDLLGVNLVTKTGEVHGQAKLTQQKVDEIRSRRAAGEMLRDLAAEYGVTKGTISRIASGHLWKGR